MSSNSIVEYCVCTESKNETEESYCSYCSFVSLLNFNGIEIERWGTGNAKTLKHLIKEINNNECVLEEDENSMLVRLLKVATAKIYFETNEAKYVLKEEKQVFKDGRTRIRTNVSSLTEKMEANEKPKDSIIRGVKEELGIQGELKITTHETTSETIYSESYPTLLSQYEIHSFNVYLTEEQFNMNGYKEEQEDKTTYFVWITEGDSISV